MGGKIIKKRKTCLRCPFLLKITITYDSGRVSRIFRCRHETQIGFEKPNVARLISPGPMVPTWCPLAPPSPA